MFRRKQRFRLLLKMQPTKQPLKRYDCWYDGVGEVMIGSIEAKSHKEARRFFINRLVMRMRKKEQ